MPHLPLRRERPYWDHGPEASQAPARPQTMKRHNLPFIVFGTFLAGSAGYTSAIVINALAPLIGLNGPTWAAIVGCLIFAASVLFLYYLKSN